MLEQALYLQTQPVDESQELPIAHGLNQGGVPVTRIALWMSALLILSQSNVVEAQRRTLPPLPGADSRPDVNPVHERQKSEAEQAYKAKRYDKTIELTSRVIAENQRDHVAYYLRGSARIEQAIQSRNAKLARDGINDARLAINYGGQDAPAMYFLPYLYGMTNLSAIEGRDQHAEVAIQIASQTLSNSAIKPEDKANIYYQRGLAQSQIKKYSASAADFEQAIRLVSEHLGAHIGAADAYSKAGNQAHAKQAYDRTVQRFSSNPLVYNNRGMYLQQIGQNDQAIVDFTRALEIDKYFFTAHTNRGYAFLQQAQYTAAENDFSESLRLNPNQPMIHSLRGTSRLLQGQFDGAIADYQEVIKANPQNGIAHADLGFAQFFAGNYPAARSEFQKAIAIDAKHSYLDPWIGLCLVKGGQADAAQQQFAERLAKPLGQRDWVDHLVHFVNGRTTADQLLAAISKDQNVRNAQMCEAYFFIGERLARAGDANQAQQQFQAAVQTKATNLSAFRGSQLALEGLSRN